MKSLRDHQPTSNTLKFSIIFITFIYLIATVIIAFNNYNPLPYWDEWDGNIGFIINIEKGNYAELFSQHNEHRIVISKIFFWLDYLVFNSSGVFLIALNYGLALFALIILLLFLKEMINEKNISEYKNIGITKIYVVSTLIIFIFSCVQHGNFGWGFQSQFFLAYSLPLLTFYLIYKSYQSAYKSNLFFLVACLTAVLSAGTMANGLATLPLSVLLAWVLGLGWKRLLTLIALTTVTIFLYLYDFQSKPGHGNIIESITNHPFQMLDYIFNYLGSPFAILSLGKIFGKFIGIFIFIFSFLFFIKIIKSKKKLTLEITLLTFILYIGATAFLKAGGRVNFGVDQAFSSRYTTPTLMLYSVLLILLIPKIAKLFERNLKLYFPQLFITPLIFFTMQIEYFSSIVIQSPIIIQLPISDNFNQNIFEIKVSALALELGIEDEQQITKLGALYPSSSHIMPKAEFLVKNDLSIFNSDLLRGVRESIGNKLEKNNIQCQGNIKKIDVTPIENITEYQRISGEIQNPKGDTTAKSIYRLDRDGIVMGYALVNQHNSVFKGYTLDSNYSKLYFKSPEMECFY